MNGYSSITNPTTYTPLSFQRANCEISPEQKQAARVRMAKRDYNNPDNTLYSYDGANYSLRPQLTMRYI